VPNLAPRVKIELDKERELFFDMNCWFDVEEEIKKPFLEMNWNDFNEIAKLLWVILRQTDKDLTFRDARAFIWHGNLKEIKQLLCKVCGVELRFKTPEEVQAELEKGKEKGDVDPNSSPSTG
jgi:hypothetical protein